MRLSANEAARSSARAERSRIAPGGAEPRGRLGAGPGRSFNDITIVWQRRQPGRRRAVPSGSRQDLQLAVLAEVVVVGDRADDPVLAGPQVHARPDVLSPVRGRGGGVLLLLVGAERAVELEDRDVERQPSDVPSLDVDATRGDRDPLRKDPVLV